MIKTSKICKGPDLLRKNGSMPIHSEKGSNIQIEITMFKL